MNKFIILILAVLAVSTYGFRMRSKDMPTEEEAVAFFEAMDDCWEENCEDWDCVEGEAAAWACSEAIPGFGKFYFIYRYIERVRLDLDKRITILVFLLLLFQLLL